MTLNIRNKVILVNSCMENLMVTSDRQDLHSEKSYLNPDFHENFGIALVFSKRFFDNWNGKHLMNKND